MRRLTDELRKGDSRNPILYEHIDFDNAVRA